MRKIERTVLQQDGINVQRVGDLTTAQANINRFCDQRGRLPITTKSDIFQQNMGWGGKSVIDGIKSKVVAAVL